MVEGRAGVIKNSIFVKGNQTYLSISMLLILVDYLAYQISKLGGHTYVGSESIVDLE